MKSSRPTSLAVLVALLATPGWAQTDPRWGRAEKSYGEDPYLVSRIGVAFIKGLQGSGEDLYGPDRIIASPKHFVADGEPIGGLNATRPRADRRSANPLGVVTDPSGPPASGPAPGSRSTRPE